MVIEIVSQHEMDNLLHQCFLNPNDHKILKVNSRTSDIKHVAMGWNNSVTVIKTESYEKRLKGEFIVTLIEDTEGSYEFKATPLSGRFDDSEKFKVPLDLDEVFFKLKGKLYHYKKQ